MLRPEPNTVTSIADKSPWEQLVLSTLDKQSHAKSVSQRVSYSTLTDLIKVDTVLTMNSEAQAGLVDWGGFFYRGWTETLGIFIATKSTMKVWVLFGEFSQLLLVQEINSLQNVAQQLWWNRGTIPFLFQCPCRKLFWSFHGKSTIDTTFSLGKLHFPETQSSI